ncbi:MmgE/PrpD family protein [Lentibacillus salinarum]|uniref:MmgE/PrpD family protein n=1 Tax=Lentibacillus salinarum TaxID=446820 RepID=A0ABW3ZRA8_9BACI
MPLSKVSSYIENEKYENLSPEVVTMVKKAFMDFIAAAYAGYQNRVSKITFKNTKWFGEEGCSTIIGREKQVSPFAAAFINGTLSSCMDIDDGHRNAIGHPACMVIPPVLALSELKPVCSGKDFITSILVGYEVGIRCGIIMNSNHEQLFYGSGGWAIFGSAAGAAKTKGLTGNYLQNSLTVGEVYGPTAQCEKSISASSMTKESVGWGAATGLMSVLLAETGFTGPENILMDKHFYRIDSKSVFKTLGKIYEIESIYFKQFPSCKWSHSPITAALKIKEKYNPNIEEISEIVIETFKKALTLNHVSPQSSEAAQYSIPYTVATALCYNAVKPYHVSDRHLKNEKVYNIAKKISLKQADDLESLFPDKRPARLKIIMNDGEIFSEEVHLVKGDSEAPLTWKDLIEKFHVCTEKFLDNEKRSSIIDQVQNLENLTDIRKLTALMR